MKLPPLDEVTSRRLRRVLNPQQDYDLAMEAARAALLADAGREALIQQVVSRHNKMFNALPDHLPATLFPDLTEEQRIELQNEANRIRVAMAQIEAVRMINACKQLIMDQEPEYEMPHTCQETREQDADEAFTDGNIVMPCSLTQFFAYTTGDRLSRIRCAGCQEPFVFRTWRPPESKELDYLGIYGPWVHCSACDVWADLDTALGLESE